MGLILVGCMKGGSELTIPEDFNMVVGQGGGFAGLWKGYTIEADGTVKAWSGLIQNEKAEVVGKLDADQLQALWAQVQESDYFGQKSQEVGNMTAFLEITADSTMHRTTWIPHVEGIEEPETPLEKLYVFCQELALEASEKEMVQ